VYSQFLPRDALQCKARLGITCRLSVRPYVSQSVTLMDCDDSHINWNSSKIISQLVSLLSSLFPYPTSRVYTKENTLTFWSE